MKRILIATLASGLALAPAVYANRRSPSGQGQAP